MRDPLLFSETIEFDEFPILFDKVGSRILLSVCDIFLKFADVVLVDMLREG